MPNFLQIGIQCCVLGLRINQGQDFLKHVESYLLLKKFSSVLHFELLHFVDFFLDEAFMVAKGLATGNENARVN
jgi:hypothetical protein